MSYIKDKFVADFDSKNTMSLHADLIELINYINEHSANRYSQASPFDDYELDLEDASLETLKQISQQLNDKIKAFVQ